MKVFILFLIMFVVGTGGSIFLSIRDELRENRCHFECLDQSFPASEFSRNKCYCIIDGKAVKQ